MILRKTDECCNNCEHYNDCANKRVVACGLTNIPETIAQNTIQDSTMPLVQDVLAKNNYRDIKTDQNTTVTIDLEKIKKKLQENIYKGLNCNFINNC